MMRMTPQDHPFQRAEPAEYSKYGDTQIPPNMIIHMELY